MRVKRCLRRVIERNIRTFAVVEEMLECGHRQNAPLVDLLTAKHRVCGICQKQLDALLSPSAVPVPKKYPQRVIDPARFEPPWKKTA